MEHSPPPGAVSVVLDVTADGRIVIPAEAELGLSAPERASASVVDELMAERRAQAARA